MTSSWAVDHRAVIAAPVTPRVPLVALSLTGERPTMRIADAVAVIGVGAAGNTIAFEGATERQCARRKCGAAKSKGDCKSSYSLT